LRRTLVLLTFTNQQNLTNFSSSGNFSCLQQIGTLFENTAAIDKINRSPASHDCLRYDRNFIKLKIMKMKMNTTSKVRVDERLLHEIQQEIMETLAIDVELKRKKPQVFCAADLWNIHRKKRPISRRF
jgi:hypothetical protein